MKADVATPLVSTLLRRFGECRLRVSGRSMLPAIRPADILVIHAIDITRVAAGDVVLFAREGRLFAHRVVEMHADARVLITRGDAHSHPDSPVPASLLLGRVEGVLRNGTAVSPALVPSRRISAGVSTVLFQSLFSIRALIARSADFSGRICGWHVRKGGDGQTAFDDPPGQVSGTWVLGRSPSTLMTSSECTMASTP